MMETYPMSEAKANYFSTIASRANNAFKDHILRTYESTEQVKFFFFSKPDTLNYSFQVIFTSQTVVVTGDIGDTIFKCYDKDSYKWLLGAVDSLEYLASKSTDKEQEFNSDYALAFIEELKLEGRAELASDLLLEWDQEDDANRWMESCYELNIDDPPDCKEYSFEVLWICNALRYFVKALPK